MPSETVADKINRLAEAKGLPTDAILSAIYAGWTEEQILAANSYVSVPVSSPPSA
jgi:hypothetical protein